MDTLIRKLPVILLLALPALAFAQTDPLDTSFMPTIDENPADYPSNIWITGSLTKVRQDSGSPGTTHWAIVYSAKNEFQGFQVHVQAPAAGLPNINVTMSNLTNSRTGTLISAASTDIVVYRESYIHITNITAVSNAYYGSAGFYPDALIPAVDPYYHQTTNAFPVNVAANQNQSVWVDVHVPSSAPSGYYSGTVTVMSGSTTLATMPVVYAVWNWLMPSTATLKTFNNIGFAAICDQQYGGYSGCSAYPGAGGNADMGVALSQVDAAVMMLDHRNTMTGNVYPPVSAAPFTTFETTYGPLLNGTPAHTTTILQGAKATTLSPWISPTPPSAATGQAWQTEFTAKGWGPTLFDYSCDEPPNGCAWSTIASNAATLHSVSPQLPALVTTNIANATANGLLNSIDWMVPIINDLDPVGGTLQRSNYNSWLSGAGAPAGSPPRQLWSYQSCESSGTCTNGVTGGPNPNTNGNNPSTWPNYNIDGTPVANRAMNWLTYLHQQTGELYYDATYCWTAPATGPAACGPSTAQSNDPWVTQYYSGGNGDGTLIYPGTTAKIGVATPIFLPSLRLKMKRDGVQDYEYLYALNAAGQGAFVATQINSWITNSYTFNNDPNNNGTFTGTITSARQALGTKLHQMSLGTLSPSVSISTPTSGAVVSGTISVKGSVTDSVSVSSVAVSVDSGTFALAVGTASWSFNLNTLSLINGVHTLQAKAWDSANNVLTSSQVGITVNNVSAPVITSTLTARGTIGTPFSYQITATNSPIAFNATGLPIGLAVSTGTGLISGTPSVAGTFNINLSAINSNGAGTATLILSVPDTLPPVVSISTPTSGATITGTIIVSGASSDNVLVSSVAVSIDGGAYNISVGTASWTFSLNSLSLINGTHSLQAKAWDSSGNSSTSRAISVLVNNLPIPVITSTPSVNGGLGTLFTYLISATNSPTSFAVSGLPPGLTLDGTSGLISGTPSQAGHFNATLSASNSTGTGSATLAIFVKHHAPTVAISFPSNGTRVSGALVGGVSVLVATGTASGDTIAISSVAVNVDGGSPVLASGTSDWTDDLGNLSNGAHTLQATAWDVEGNSSTSTIVGVLFSNLVAGPSVSTTPGLRAAFVYPDPVVPPYDPVLRVCPGIVDSIDVTIFDIVGRVVNSSSQFTGPSTGLSGTGNGEYCYEYTWTGYISSGVYFAVVHAKAAGNLIRAKIKFAVVR